MNKHKIIRISALGLFVSLIIAVVFSGSPYTTGTHSKAKSFDNEVWFSKLKAVDNSIFKDQFRCESTVFSEEGIDAISAKNRTQVLNLSELFEEVAAVIYLDQTQAGEQIKISIN